MSWTVACFCGNTFTTPPNRCEVCGESVEEFVAPSPRPRIADERDADTAPNAGRSRLASDAPAPDVLFLND